MASTYSNIKIQLMASGENNTTWGNVTNTNLGTALEEAIVGSADVTFASGNVTLTLTDTNASQTARHMRLRCTGTTGGSTRNLVVPSIEKPYIVANDCADSIVVKTAAGTGITVPAGKTMWVYSDGTNVVNVTTHLSSLTLGTPLPISSGGTGSSTALTQGSVVFAGAAGVFSQDNANFFWDDTNNQLGIGTATPTYKIEARTDAVSGFNWISSFNNTATDSYGAGFLARSSVGSAYLYMRGDGLAYVENSTNNALAFATNATEKMRITAAGDVGIGATTVTERLQVNVGTGASGFEKGIVLTNGVDANLFNYVTGTAATDKRAFITAGAANQSLTFGTLYTERMRITSAGDVGVGVVPTAKLHVAGTIQSSSGSTTAQMYADGSAAYFASVGAFPSIFITNATERMRIDSAGNLLVGTTTAQGRVSVASATGNVGFNTGTSASPERGNLWYDTDGSGWNFNIGKRQSGTFTSQVTIQDGGNVGVGTTTPQSKFHVSGGYITAGNVSSTGGSKIIGGDYSGAEHITTFGSEFSSGGPVVGYGVWPSTSAALAFVSSAAPALQRAAYTQTGNNHVWFTGASQTVAVGSAVTMSERMRLDGSGNLGLGTAPSGVRLDVNGSIRTTVGSGGTLSLFETDAVRANQLFSGADASGSFINATFSTGGTAVLRLQTANNERMRITAAGDVGIGTVSPATRLHAAGITRISDATNSTAVNIDASTTAGLTSIIAQFGGSQLAFGAAATEYVRINASGNVGIGTTSPSAKLDVNGSLRANSLTLTTALAAAQGGTGQTSYTDGQLLIGNTATGGLSKATITAGSGISVTNGNGSISIAATGGGGSVTSVGMTVPAFLSVTPSSISTSGTFDVTLSGTALPVANGGTGATTLTGVVIGNGTSAFTTVTAPSGAIVGTTDVQNLTNKTLTTGNTLDAGTSVSDAGTIAAASPGFRGLPQNAKTASYTLALTDAGKDIYISGTTAAQTITIPANGSVAFPVGTILQVTNDSNQNWSIAITTDTLLWSPNNTTGTRTLAAAGQVTIRKVTSTRWWISGVGLT